MKFIATLNNGEIIEEGTGIASYVAGEDSCWRKLVTYNEQNGLKIVGLLIKDGTKTFKLPDNAGEYNYFRRYVGDVLGTGANSEHHVCIEATYKDVVLQLWIDINDTDRMWTLVKGR